MAESPQLQGNRRYSRHPVEAPILHGKEGVDGSSPSRQRASVKCLHSALLCCLRIEHADTFRTHLRYARRIATPRDVFLHRLLGET